ncbi:MAG: hydrogenobyrinic acid a,c-diamide synthase (glutamine-hydrolyzing) [Thermoproteota archaeon]|nr:hydrogenobyrinic acid a,c-diamide synthase (glutamine-hydrolyzing) [Thermoproteota archaeon]
MNGDEYSQMQVRKIVIAGTTSGVGKTTVAVAIMYALRKKGFQVQPFKIGPDFIDPSYHTFVTNRQSRNLDVWMMGRQGVLDCFVSACMGADIAVLEGVMGLFDGMSGKNDFASTAHVAKLLDAPVLLVVDASKGARSIAAIILGFLHFDRKVNIAGIILNNIASQRHASYITEALRGLAKAPVVGLIPRNTEAKMEERHLGLVPASELQVTKKQNVVLGIAKYIVDCLDIDKILSLCGNIQVPKVPMDRKLLQPVVRIAVALDESFNFYYSDNFDALKMCRAQLVFFSPVHGQELPQDMHGIIIGGGFPEVLADQLEENRSMIRSIGNAVDGGMPIYGECGGLMYLTRSISGFRGEKKSRKMIGIVQADTVMTQALTLNYTEAESNGALFGRARIRGHEFHYSSIQNIARDSRFAYSMEKGKGVTGQKDGFIVNDNGIAAYMHLHFANKKLAERLVRSCVRYSRK